MRILAIGSSARRNGNSNSLMRLAVKSALAKMAGQAEEDRAWIAVGNESGDRRILAFPGLLPADAWLGAGG